MVSTSALFIVLFFHTKNHISFYQHRAWGNNICCETFDAVRTALSEVRQVTNIRTMCEAVNKTPAAKTLLGEVHKLLLMYLTLPVVSAASERTFSALRRLKNYLRSTIKQDRLNNCLLIHCHKSITDTVDTVRTP